MPLRGQLEALLDQLGNDIGQELRLDARGVAVIEVDELMECVVTFDTRRERVDLAAPLCVVPPDDGGAVYAAALQLVLGGGWTRGATIVLSDDLPVLSLRAALMNESDDSERIEREIAGFIQIAREARDRLAERGGEALPAERRAGASIAYA